MLFVAKLSFSQLVLVNGWKHATPASSPGFYRTITIDHTKVPNTNQTDFPVTFTGTYTYLKSEANGGKVTNENAFDVYITSDAEGTTVVPFELVTWDAATGAIEMHFKASSLSSTVDNVYYLQYGKSPVSTDQSNRTGTWSNGYVAVWHFANGTTLNTNDATSNGNHLTKYGNINPSVGLVDGAALLDGADDKTEHLAIVGNSTLVGMAALTLSSWQYKTTAAYGGMRGIGFWQSDNRHYVLREPGGPLEFNTKTGNTGFSGVGAGVGIPVSSLNQWHLYTGTYDGAIMKGYVDAVVGPTTYAQTGSIDNRVTTLDTLFVASDYDGYSALTGKIDETSISSVARTADWITTEYNNKFSPSTFYTLGAETPHLAYDADAQAFFTAAGITDVTQKNAINTLVTDLKTASLWTKFYAIYPLVGGTATTCKYNLKDPRDLDVAFRLTFVGSPTFNSTGVDWNGTTQYANTNLTPSTTLLTNDQSMLVYIRENTGTAGYDLGATTGSDETALISRYSTDLSYFTINTSGFATVASTNAIGFWGVSRVSSSFVYGYKNGSQVASNGLVATSQPTIPITLGGSNRTGGVIGFSDREIGWGAISTGLTSAENSTLYTIVNTFNTALSR